MANFRNLTGQRFGRLEVLKQSGWYVTPKTGRRSAVWLCRCDCGVETEVIGHNLTTGDTTSCGCRVRSNNNEALKRDLLAGVQAVKQSATVAYRKAKERASEKGLPFELTFEEFRDIREHPCALCGFNEGVVSVDRIDSKGGYTKDNVQPLCRVCQTIKSAFPQEFLVRHIYRINRYLDENGVMRTVLEGKGGTFVKSKA